jgi:penicillin-insensitive murein endopeptidase
MRYGVISRVLISGVTGWACLSGWAGTAAEAAQPGAVPPLPVAVKGRADPRETMPAKKLFGHQRDAAPLSPSAVGFYSRGCLAGAERLEIDGPAWQAMRLSRNRNWGHPQLVRLVRRLAVEAQKHDGWPGLLVGDMSQPRGGPMLTGHRSHQIGLDADIWFTPMPDRRLSRRERERLSATSMLSKDRLSVNDKIWSMAHVRLIRRAASYSATERILVHPAIKKALCEGAGKLGGDRAWLGKVRPYWGHHYHFHVRIGCPNGSAGCRPQKPTTGDHGCDAELAHWYRLLTRPKPKVVKPRVPRKPRPPLTLARLPAQCREVLNARKITAPAPIPAQR